MRKSWGTVGIAIAGAFSALVLGYLAEWVVMWQQHAVAASPADLRHLSYGFPIKGVVQDQHGYTPTSYPASMDFGSPLENPTTSTGQGLLIDSLFGAVVVTMLVASGVFAVFALKDRWQPSTATMSTS